MSILNGAILQYHIQVKISIAEDITVHVIPAYLDSILLNLFSNAIKYRSLERRGLIEISAEKEENWVVLLVKDNGLGINMKKHGQKLFGMYKTFHRNEDARGFGLYLTKSQVEAMGGKIEVDSEEEVGSTFKVYFNGED